VRSFTDRNAKAIEQLQARGVADPDLDPVLAAQALSAMVGRMAYFRYVQGLGNASVDSLARTLTRLWAGALGIPVARDEHRRNRKPSKPRR
jgi:hypothetical protein